MEQKKIYPYLIDSKRMAGYYELLLEDKFNLKIFDKKKNSNIYDYFMPSIREFLFWSFDMDQKEEVTQYNKMKIDLKAAVCNMYSCNVFEKDEDLVICFSTGICFAVVKDEKTAAKLAKYEQAKKMEEINLRQGCYKEKISKEEQLYAYVLELYKLIYLNKINKELQNPDFFDKARNEFVEFTQKVYTLEETDKDNFSKELKEKLELDKIYVKVENEFDLLYKNNKLNENLIYKRFIIILLVVLIIIGIINLSNWIS